MLYNTLTGLITSTETLPNILHQVLHEVLQVVPAKGAGIYLHDSTKKIYTLQCAENAPLLPEEQNEIDHKQIKTIPAEE